jgi:hypothetical protein
MRGLADEVKQRGRLRFKTDQQSPG